MLLQTGADVDATLARSRSLQYADRRATALYFAVANGGTETAEALLNAGASLTLDPVSPLLIAVHQGSVRSVSLLLERGADANARISSFTTFPAAVALCKDNLRLLKCLLDNGCDPISCFTCTHGRAPHPRTDESQSGHVLHNISCSETPGRPMQVDSGHRPISHQMDADHEQSTCSHLLSQFCQWISAADMRPWAGPILDLLLEHVAQVQPCSRLLELLDSREEWLAVKRKSRKQAAFSVTRTPDLIDHDAVSFFLHSIAPPTAAPLQVTDTDPRGQRQSEVAQEPASARQTDQIPQPGWLTLGYRHQRWLNLAPPCLLF